MQTRPPLPLLALSVLLALAGCAAPAASELPTAVFESGKADQNAQLDVSGQVLRLQCRNIPCAHEVRLGGWVGDPEEAGLLVAVVSPDRARELHEWIEADAASLVDALDAGELFDDQASVIPADWVRDGLDIAVHQDSEEQSLYIRALSWEATGAVSVRARRELPWDEAIDVAPDNEGEFNVVAGEDGRPGLWSFHVPDRLDLTYEHDVRVDVEGSIKWMSEALYVCDATGEVIPLGRHPYDIYFEDTLACDAGNDSARIYVRATSSRDGEPYRIRVRLVD